MTNTGFGHKRYIFQKLSKLSASSPALCMAINSDFIVDWAIHVCLKDFQDTAAPPRVNTYPLVDFDSSESAIQASLYPSSTGRYYPYLKAYSMVCDTNLILVVD